VVLVIKKSAMIAYHCTSQMVFQDGNFGPRQDQPPLWKPLLKKMKVPEKKRRLVVMLWKSCDPKKPKEWMEWHPRIRDNSGTNWAQGCKTRSA
jgi:hypothetical protein